MARKAAWKPRLENRVRDGDRLVVWDYVRPVAGEERQPSPHFEITDAREILEFLDCIEIDEPASTGRCMCLGSPHFDFMAAGEVLATLTLHHGVRLRWEGKWPADAELTRGSAFQLCEWLRQRGIPRPWFELQQQVKRSLAWQRRAAAIETILPDGLARRFLRVQDEGEVIELFRPRRESRTVQAGWCLRILGCDVSSWELIDNVTHAQELAGQVMPVLGKRACGEALRRCIRNAPERDACFGAARVLFYFGGWENFTRSSLNAALPTLIRIAMLHPRQRNRQYVMWVLSQLDGGEEPLRWILEGQWTPEEIDPGQAAEPDGITFTRGLAPGEPVHASDPVYAAWLLGTMHAKGVRATIEDLAVEARNSERRVLEKALEALGH